MFYAHILPQRNTHTNARPRADSLANNVVRDGDTYLLFNSRKLCVAFRMCVREYVENHRHHHRAHIVYRRCVDSDPCE